MSYTTSPVANRIGCSIGGRNSSIVASNKTIFLKSYLILKEYLRFYQINLLELTVKTRQLPSVTSIQIYKHLPYVHKKRKQFFFYRTLNDNGSIHTWYNKKAQLSLKYLVYKKKFNRNIKTSYLKSSNLTHRQSILFRTGKKFTRFISTPKKKFYKNKNYFSKYVRDSLRTTVKSYVKPSKKKRHAKKKPSLKNSLYIQNYLTRSQIQRRSYQLLTNVILNCLKQGTQNKNSFQNELLASSIDDEFGLHKLRKQKSIILWLNSVLPNTVLITELNNAWIQVFISIFFLNRSKQHQICWNKYKNIFYHQRISKRLQDRKSFYKARALSIKYNITPRNLKIPVILSKKEMQLFLSTNLKKNIDIHLKILFRDISEGVLLLPVHNMFKYKSQLRRAAEGSFFKRLLFAFITTQAASSPQLVADLIATELAIPRRHKGLLRNINALFNAILPKNLTGYKILIDGKLQGKLETDTLIINFQRKEKVPFQEFNKRVSYAISIARTYTGLFGVSVWFYY
jgi:hypothetical protein